MKKEKYYYNPNSLRYEKIEASWGNRILRTVAFLCASLVLATVITVIALQFIDSPKEQVLRNEIETLQQEYKLMEKSIDGMTATLEGLRNRDKNIYRVVYGGDPPEDSEWLVGVGGSRRYNELRGYDNGELMVRINSKIDKLKNQLVLQSTSYDDIVELVKNKEDYIASIPSIQPVANKDLRRIASGFGYRTDPVYGVTKFHAGIDFTASTGTDIYATGNGKVITVNYSKGGYGNQVLIDHGYGYVTRYAHLSKFNCREGQKVKRGEVIGYVGNTGKSTGPHLHYEVIYNDTKIDPIHFFYNDLSNEEYALMLELAANTGKSYD